MLKLYCRSCGAPTEYTINKPKICCQCGNSFASLPTITHSAVGNLVTPLKNEKHFSRQIKNKPLKAIYKIKSSETAQDTGNEDIEQNIDLEDNEETVDYVPEINKLEVDLIGNKVTGVKLGNIVGTSNAPRQINTVKGKGKKINKKEVLEQFRREAGKTSRMDIGESENE